MPTDQVILAMPKPKIPPRDRLAHGAPALLIVTMFLALALGFWQGDLTPAEAERINAANALLDPAAFPEMNGTPAAPFSRFLAMSHRLLGRTQVTALSARSVSVTLLLLAITTFFAWLRQTLGAGAAVVGVLALGCSLPGIWASTSVSEISFLLLSLLGLGGSTTAFSKGSYHRALALLVAVGGLALFTWTLQTSRPDRELAYRHDWLLGPFYTVLLSLPWSIALFELCRRDYWRHLSRLQTILSADAIMLALTGIVLGGVRPELWIECGLLTLLGSSLALALVWENLHVLPRPSESLWTYAIALGIPAIAVLAAGLRIGFHYQQMEKVQAVFVTGLVAIALGSLLLPWRRPVLCWIPTVAVLVACKIIYLHALLPERDVRHSSRPHARAIARHLEPDAVLYTPLTMDASFRYYLDRPIRPLESLSEQNEPSSHAFALVHALEWSRLKSDPSARWEIIRQLEWAGSGELYLLRVTRSAAHAAHRAPASKG